jgi:hypothetical protein
MKHEDKVNAIQFIRPNAEFLLNDNEIQWLDEKQNEPTDAEIEAGLIAYQAKIEADKADAVAKKEAAQAKLAALGLTADDLKALGLGGN